MLRKGTGIQAAGQSTIFFIADYKLSSKWLNVKVFGGTGSSY